MMGNISLLWVEPLRKKITFSLTCKQNVRHTNLPNFYRGTKIKWRYNSSPFLCGEGVFAWLFVAAFFICWFWHFLFLTRYNFLLILRFHTRWRINCWSRMVFSWCRIFCFIFFFRFFVESALFVELVVSLFSWDFVFDL